MNYLKQKLLVHSIEELDSSYPEGILIVTDNQRVIDACRQKDIPVVAFEHDDARNLDCKYIVLFLEEVDDEEFETYYRRLKGIPLDITTTRRTYIREYCPRDLDALFALYNEPHACDFIEPLFDYEAEREYEEKYIKYIYEVYGFGQWLIFDKETDKLIGRAGIERRETCFEANQLELGYMIAPHRWREGLGFEVCDKIMELGFNEFGADSIIARCHPDNVASIGLLKKLGYDFDATLENGDLRYIYRL